MRPLLLAAALWLIAFTPGSALAISLDQAKQQGLVGETPAGYLAPVSAPSGEVQSLVSSTNSKRREKYQEIARKNGTDLRAVELLAGKKAIEETPSGQYIQLPSGQWQKK